MPMRIDVVTLFPELFEVPLRTSIIGRAEDLGAVAFGIHDLREHGLGRHRSVDDYPYGGGAGMVMRPEPLFAAIEPLRAGGAASAPSGRWAPPRTGGEQEWSAAPSRSLRPSSRSGRRAQP